ncbi:MAG: hypothetical protein ACD_55C00133G0001 [uncultured bacterium]|nr:MAG: hypothetical protein ACD_55C00133G0001 [uncultured bacterium]
MLTLCSGSSWLKSVASTGGVKETSSILIGTVVAGGSTVRLLITMLRSAERIRAFRGTVASGKCRNARYTSSLVGLGSTPAKTPLTVDAGVTVRTPLELRISASTATSLGIVVSMTGRSSCPPPHPAMTSSSPTSTSPRSFPFMFASCSIF